MYKQVFKLLLSNFHLVWKMLAYLIISLLCVIGLAYACSLPIINVLAKEGIGLQAKTLFINFSENYNLYEFMASGVNVIEQFFVVIANNIETLWLYIFLLLFIIIVFRAFLTGFYKLAATNVLYYYLSSNIKIGFTSSMFSTFKLNLKYQLTNLIIQLPLNIALFIAFYYILKWLVLSSGLIIIAPIILVILYIFLISLKITFFSGWLPAMVVLNRGAFAALKKGVVAVFRRFYRSFSTAILIVISLIVLNIVCAFATFGASLIVTLPMTYLTILIFNIVMYYLSQGMRFYVDSENIVAPKKFEETDRYSKQKYLI